MAEHVMVYNEPIPGHAINEGVPAPTRRRPRYVAATAGNKEDILPVPSMATPVANEGTAEDRRDPLAGNPALALPVI